jgi:CubicO group peptidase (beta-lactamase class C family)
VKSLDRAARVLDDALAARAFSATAAEVGRLGTVEWGYAGGRLGADASAPLVTQDTIFDLASLTKPLATTTLALELVTAGRFDLDAPVSSHLSGWTGAERASVTVRDLFEHSSGLPAYRDYFRTHAGRTAYEAAIAGEPLEYRPRTRSLYSDLGFILLGFILQDVADTSLAEQFQQWRERAGVGGPLDFLPPPEWKPRTALTENDPWRGRVLQGDVHDENAAALGGIAAHAGLFGTAAAVGEAARWWLSLLAPAGAPDADKLARTAAAFVTRSMVPGSSRAIGWDTMLPTSSCGTCLSPRAIGHTGFTGTSLWIDPAKDLYVVLLTNRVHPTRNNERIQQVRRDFHDAVMADLYPGNEQ